METVEIDARIEDADWTKQSWDLPPYKSDLFFIYVPEKNLPSFRETPVYKNAVAAGLIKDDEWQGSPVGRNGAQLKAVSPTSTPESGGNK